MGMASSSTRSVKDIPYGTARECCLDLILPAEADANERAPVFVFVHGGAWQSGDKSFHDNLGFLTEKHGVVVALINYKLCPGSWDFKKNPNVPNKHPSHINDVAAAVAWLVKTGASQYKFSPNNVFLCGHSAGGHMLGMLYMQSKLLLDAGVERHSSGPLGFIRGFVATEGIFDLTLIVDHFPTYRDWFIARAFGADDGVWPAASPAQLTPDGDAAAPLPPWLLFQSPRDELVNMAQTDAMAARLRAINAPVEVFTDFATGHDETVGKFGKDSHPPTAKLVAFIDAHKLT